MSDVAYIDYYLHLAHESVVEDSYFAIRCDEEHLERVYNAIVKARDFHFKTNPASHWHVLAFADDDYSTVIGIDIVRLAALLLAREDIPELITFAINQVPEHFVSIPDCGHIPPGWEEY